MSSFLCYFEPNCIDIFRSYARFCVCVCVQLNLVAVATMKQPHCIIPPPKTKCMCVLAFANQYVSFLFPSYNCQLVSTIFLFFFLFIFHPFRSVDFFFRLFQIRSLSLYALSCPCCLVLPFSLYLPRKTVIERKNYIIIHWCNRATASIKTYTQSKSTFRYTISFFTVVWFQTLAMLNVTSPIPYDVHLIHRAEEQQPYTHAHHNSNDYHTIISPNRIWNQMDVHLSLCVCVCIHYEVSYIENVSLEWIANFDIQRVKTKRTIKRPSQSQPTKHFQKHNKINRMRTRTRGQRMCNRIFVSFQYYKYHVFFLLASIYDRPRSAMYE